MHRCRPEVPSATAVLLAMTISLPLAHASSQASTPSPGAQACAGDTVTTVDIVVRPPSSIRALEGVSQATSRAVRARFATTRPHIVRAYLRVRPGDVCTELDRTESERVLRAQSFIASATVRAYPVGPGRVRIQVDVVDELPIVVDGGLRGGKFAFASLGTLNFLGRGLTIVAKGTRGFAYRNGFGIRLAQYGAFGGPFELTGEAERTPLGEVLALGFAAPFVTDLQRHGFRAEVRTASRYHGVFRPADPDVALETRRISYDVSWVTRLGVIDRIHTAGFLGAALLGEAIRVRGVATMVTDSGLVPAPDAALPRYPGIERLHVAAIAGLRSLRFLTVRGFDALSAAQDVGVGIQMHALAGPSVWPANGRGEFFAATDIYAGVGRERSFLSAHVTSETRGNLGSPVWKGMISSARFSWYLRPSRVRTRVLSLTGAAVWKVDFPAQLTLRDMDGGVAGFRDSHAAGGFRAVARVEERRRFDWFRTRADFAIATFAEGGKLWAGDVPYGRGSPIRRSLGIAFLAAYPSGAKRTYRVDIAFPLNAARGGTRVELRFSAFDRTRLLSAEPRDVSRLRTGAVPANLMKW